ncbi:MAG: hypothetical protein WDA75_24300 [Candidatus Latescibacterota bacterium]
MQFAPLDIRAVDITLFLECSQRGVAPDKVVGGAVLVAKALSDSDGLPF